MGAGPSTVSTTLNASKLGLSFGLRRLGRVLLDCAAFLALVPLLTFVILGGVVALVASLAPVLVHFSILQQTELISLGYEFAAVFALYLVGALLLAGLFATASAGRIWAALLLPIASLAPFLVVILGVEIPTTNTGGVIVMMFLFVFPALIMAGAILIIASAFVQMHSAIGRGSHAWPLYSISMFASRYAWTRPALTLAGLAIVLRFVLSMLAVGTAIIVSMAVVSMFAGLVFTWLGFPTSPLDRIDAFPAVLWACVAVQSLLDFVLGRGGRAANLAVALFGALASTELFTLLNYGLQNYREDPSAGYRSMVPSGGEFAILGLLPLAWLFRGFISRPFVAAFDRLRLHSARTARELSNIRTEMPVLFLRSFADDEQMVRGGNGLMEYACGAARRTVRLEEIVAEVMFARGPLVALGNPELKTAPLGAARDVVSHDNWKAAVLDYLSRSQTIVCFFGRTPSFLWEISTIIEANLLHKMVLVLPPSYPHDRLLFREAPQLARAYGLTSETSERTALTHARAIAFNPSSGRFEALCSRTFDAAAYREVLRRCAALSLS